MKITFFQTPRKIKLFSTINKENHLMYTNYYGQRLSVQNTWIISVFLHTCPHGASEPWRAAAHEVSDRCENIIGLYSKSQVREWDTHVRGLG